MLYMCHHVWYVHNVYGQLISSYVYTSNMCCSFLVLFWSFFFNLLLLGSSVHAQQFSGFSFNTWQPSLCLLLLSQFSQLFIFLPHSHAFRKVVFPKSLTHADHEQPTTVALFTNYHFITSHTAAATNRPGLIRSSLGFLITLALLSISRGLRFRRCCFNLFSVLLATSIPPYGFNASFRSSAHFNSSHFSIPSHSPHSYSLHLSHLLATSIIDLLNHDFYPWLR